MSEKEPEPDNVDEEPDHTEDPREQETGTGGYPETHEEGTNPDGDEDE